ncbi:kinase-like protein, partial [Exidia glandulosa HHB12029]
AAGLNYLHTRSPQILHGDFRAVTHLAASRWTTVSTDGRVYICNFDFQPLQRHNLGMDSSLYLAPTTRRWLSPEAANLAIHTAESDVYSFGCFMWELYAGRPPFSNISGGELEITLRHGERPKRPTSLVNDDLWDLIWMCWSRGPRRRPTMARVHDRLRAIGEARTVTPGPLDVPSPPGPSGTLSTA